MLSYSTQRKKSFRHVLALDFKRNGALYLMVLPVIVIYFIYNYIPLFGVIIAFKNYKPNLGVFGSGWAKQMGMEHFISFFQGVYFSRTVRNTLLISLYNIAFGFPAPIILAILLNEVRSVKYKRIIQTFTYFPHFISQVVICGIIIQFCLTDGLFNYVGSLFGVAPKSLLQDPRYFRTIYVGTGIWQGVGWSSIIYLAAIAGIDPQLYEASALDGATRIGNIWHVTLPGIKNTIIILLIMAVGNMMDVGSEKILLLYNPAIYETADVISTYIYRRGLLEFNWSFSTAVNLFNSIINFLLVLTANSISRKFSETSLF
ncbi:MAG: ABC transporter permease [Christensenellales bacterium]|jgi:putative aldouronate transport system permease protein